MGEWVGGSVRGCVHGFVLFCCCFFPPPLYRPRAGIVRRTTSVLPVSSDISPTSALARAKPSARAIKSSCVRCSTACDGVFHTPLGRFFEARLLNNQESANSERCVLGKLSARSLHRRPFWHRHYLFQLLWRYRPMENRPIHRRVR